jgi:hypothetical protein
VFTRILLHKPRFLVIDEALDALDDDARNRIIRLFKGELKDAGIIDIGRPTLTATSLHAFCTSSMIPGVGAFCPTSDSLTRPLIRPPNSISGSPDEESILGQRSECLLDRPWLPAWPRLGP